MRRRLLPFAAGLALLACTGSTNATTGGGDGGGATAGGSSSAGGGASSAGGSGSSAGGGAPDSGLPECSAAFAETPTIVGEPPFGGTSFITNDLIQESDPSAFVDLSYAGTGRRQMFDRRVNDWVNLDAHLFPARFGSATTIEIQVNPEFDQADAEAEARRYAAVIGQLPGFLLRDVETVWIHAGVQPFGGGNDNLLIHTGQGELYARDGVLEEILVHEASHTSVDADLARDARWAEAQGADAVSLSTYARDNFAREDVAESIGPFLALTYRRARIPPATATSIEGAIPNRLLYLRCRGMTMDLLP